LFLVKSAAVTRLPAFNADLESADAGVAHDNPLRG